MPELDEGTPDQAGKPKKKDKVRSVGSPLSGAARAPRPHGEEAIAVLPLDDFSRDSADACFAA